MSCIPALSLHIPEPDEQRWSTLFWVCSSHGYLLVSPSSCCGGISLIHLCLAETIRDSAVHAWGTQSNDKVTHVMQKTSFRYVLKLPSLPNECATHFETCCYWGQEQPRTGAHFSTAKPVPMKRLNNLPRPHCHIAVTLLVLPSKPFLFLALHQADPEVLPSLGTPAATATALWWVTKPLKTSSNLKTSNPVT